MSIQNVKSSPNIKWTAAVRAFTLVSSRSLVVSWSNKMTIIQIQIQNKNL